MRTSILFNKLICHCGCKYNQFHIHLVDFSFYFSQKKRINDKKGNPINDKHLEA